MPGHAQVFEQYFVPNFLSCIDEMMRWKPRQARSSYVSDVGLSASGNVLPSMSPPTPAPLTPACRVSPSCWYFRDPCAAHSAFPHLMFSGFSPVGQGSVLDRGIPRSGSSAWHRVNIPLNLLTYCKFNGITFYHPNISLIHVLCALRGSL